MRSLLSTRRLNSRVAAAHIVIPFADGAAPRKAVPSRSSVPDGETDGLSPPAAAEAADHDSGLAALATAAAADVSSVEKEALLGHGAVATGSLPRRSGRAVDVAAPQEGAAPAASRKRAAEAAPVGAAAPLQKKGAAVVGQAGAPVGAVDDGSGGGRTQQCTGCLETKPLDAFYKVTV